MMMKPTVKNRLFVICSVLNDPTLIGMIFLGGYLSSPTIGAFQGSLRQHIFGLEVLASNPLLCRGTRKYH